MHSTSSLEIKYKTFLFYPESLLIFFFYLLPISPEWILHRLLTLKLGIKFHSMKSTFIISHSRPLRTYTQQLSLFAPANWLLIFAELSYFFLSNRGRKVLKSLIPFWSFPFFPCVSLFFLSFVYHQTVYKYFFYRLQSRILLFNRLFIFSLMV